MLARSIWRYSLTSVVSMILSRTTFLLSFYASFPLFLFLFMCVWIMFVWIIIFLSHPPTLFNYIDYFYVYMLVCESMFASSAKSYQHQIRLYIQTVNVETVSLLWDIVVSKQKCQTIYSLLAFSADCNYTPMKSILLQICMHSWEKSIDLSWQYCHPWEQLKI